MGAYQRKQEQQKESFCLVALYDEDQRQPMTQQTDQEEEDLEMIDEEDHEASSFSLTSASSNSSDTVDDASSSSSSSMHSGALNDLSELMFNLPIKRGLSKFYQGKSQSFTSLARVTSLEDLAKKSSGCGGYARRMKACRSYGGGLNLNNHQQRSAYTTTPKAAISKKSGSSSSSCLRKTINRS